MSGIPRAILQHRIQPALRERMAPQYAPSRHHSTAQRAISLYRFHRVFRTRRHVAARRRKRWRNPPFVKSQQPERERLHSYFSTSFFAITSKARPTSSSTTENSSVSTDFFGLITTSTAPAPLLVNTLEVGMLQQPRRARKVCSRRRCGLLYTPVGSVGAHQFTILHNN